MSESAKVKMHKVYVSESISPTNVFFLGRIGLSSIDYYYLYSYIIVINYSSNYLVSIASWKELYQGCAGQNEKM